MYISNYYKMFSINITKNDLQIDEITIVTAKLLWWSGLGFGNYDFETNKFESRIKVIFGYWDWRLGFEIKVWDGNLEIGIGNWDWGLDLLGTGKYKLG